jgi:hypothetical protein
MRCIACVGDRLLAMFSWSIGTNLSHIAWLCTTCCMFSQDVMASNMYDCCQTFWLMIGSPILGHRRLLLAFLPGHDGYPGVSTPYYRMLLSSRDMHPLSWTKIIVVSRRSAPILMAENCSKIVLILHLTSILILILILLRLGILGLNLYSTEKITISTAGATLISFERP